MICIAQNDAILFVGVAIGFIGVAAILGRYYGWRKGMRDYHEIATKSVMSLHAVLESRGITPPSPPELPKGLRPRSAR